jgi:hypothetical protein
LDLFPDLVPQTANGACEEEYDQKVYAWNTLLEPWRQ